MTVSSTANAGGLMPHLAVVVGVNVDEPRGDEQAGAVDLPLAGAGQRPADRRNGVANDLHARSGGWPRQWCQ